MVDSKNDNKNEAPKMSFDLNMHTARLLMDEPFFAAISRRVDKRATTAIPTAGVLINRDSAQFEMLYNPEFFAGLTDEQRTDVLKHEFYHILFLHVTSRMPEDVDVKLWNVATDLAINSHLYNLPEGGLIPGKEGTPFEDLPRGESAEWYLANMPDFQSQSGPSGEGENGDESGDDNGEGSGQGSSGEQGGDSDSGASNGIPDSMDDHSGWSNDGSEENQKLNEEVQNIAKERLKEIVKNAAQECSRNNNWGSVPTSCKTEIMKVLESKIDWKKVLRYFIKTSQKANKSSSMKRINRRYPYVHAGRKTNRVAKVAISIDQSGSVDNEMLTKFFAELNSLASIAEFTVIPFDTTVDEKLVYTWKKGERRKWERVMCGGTDFNPPTDYVNERDFDGHIILTDMYAPKPKASKCQRMWMTTPEYAKRPYFTTKERIVAID